MRCERDWFRWWTVIDMRSALMWARQLIALGLQQALVQAGAARAQPDRQAVDRQPQAPAGQRVEEPRAPGLPADQCQAGVDAHVDQGMHIPAHLGTGALACQALAGG